MLLLIKTTPSAPLAKPLVYTLPCQPDPEVPYRKLATKPTREVCASDGDTLKLYLAPPGRL